jgi:glucose/arabinose dehydrogenase
MPRVRQALSFTTLVIVLSACGESAQLPISAGTGLNPQLPPPHPTWIPTINIAQAVGWPANTKPPPASGLTVNAFAASLDHPRWLYVLPNGDVLVAETNAPQRPDEGWGIKSWLMKQVLSMAGAGTPSANHITLLRDKDGDGVALIGTDFYVANTDAPLKFNYTDGETHIAAAGIKVLDLPAGHINHHWTKNRQSKNDH